MAAIKECETKDVEQQNDAGGTLHWIPEVPDDRKLYEGQVFNNLQDAYVYYIRYGVHGRFGVRSSTQKKLKNVESVEKLVRAITVARMIERELRLKKCGKCGEIGLGHNSRSYDRKRVEAKSKAEAMEREKAEAEARKLAEEYHMESAQ